MLYVVMGTCFLSLCSQPQCFSAPRSVRGRGSSPQDWQWQVARWAVEGKKADLLLGGGRIGLCRVVSVPSLTASPRP